MIKQLSKDLSAEFLEMRGFSVRNLQYMVQFAESYSIKYLQGLRAQRGDDLLEATSSSANTGHSVTAQAVLAQTGGTLTDSNAFYHFVNLPIAKITWSHHIILMDKVKNPEERLYYTHRTLEEGWSTRVLVHKIEQKLYESQGRLPNNFDATLPPSQSELAKQTLKDSYIFDFLSLGSATKERDKVVAKYSLKDSNRPIGVTTYQLLPKEERFVKLLNQLLT